MIGQMKYKANAKKATDQEKEELFACVHACIQYFLECHKSSVPVTMQDAANALEVYDTVTDKAQRQTFLASFEKE